MWGLLSLLGDRRPVGCRPGLFTRSYAFHDKGGALRASAGEQDDRSDAIALAIAAIDQTPPGVFAL
jgi:hypothetical protein